MALPCLDDESLPFPLPFPLPLALFFDFFELFELPFPFPIPRIGGAVLQDGLELGNSLVFSVGRNDGAKLTEPREDGGADDEATMLCAEEGCKVTPEGGELFVGKRVDCVNVGVDVSPSNVGLSVEGVNVGADVSPSNGGASVGDEVGLCITSMVGS